MSDTEIFKVLDGLSEKCVFKTKLITSTAIGLMVATMAMPSDAYEGDTGGSGNTATGLGSSAFGASNYARGESSSAFGYLNTASGNYSSAFGVVNAAFGMGSSAFGFFAQAGNSSDDQVYDNNVTSSSKDRYATAVGAYVQATGLYALALGNQKDGMTKTTASGQSAIAIGTGATASVQDAIAIGTGAIASSARYAVAIGAGATATKNAVAIGQGSQATEAGTVSVGTSSSTRKIVNVTAGTADTDAVNYSQIKNLKNYTAGTGITISDAGVISADGGGSSVTLDTTFNAGSTNGATSQAIANYLNNNYYRNNKKSEILGNIFNYFLEYSL